jgi:Kef-type K+ transport system membrane component KefB
MMADPQLVYPVGMMLLMLAAFSVPFHLAKQSQIIAMITVGVVFGPVSNYAEDMGLSVATAASLFDLGILFVLFMGGMEVDLEALRKFWKLVLVNSLGQILLNFGVFIGLGTAFFKGVEGVTTVSLVYFGLCCTLSSTILVLGSLKKRGEMESLQGQIILGLMVMQDVCAVVAIALMAAFDPNAVGIDTASIVGYLMMWFVVLLICLYLLNRFVCDALFRFCAQTPELLFIGVYAYSLGIAAIFGHFLPAVNGSSFSQEIGVFFAGVSIAALDYRVQIEAFVQPIKDFGVLLFFFMLGITLPSDMETLKAALVPGVIIALLTVFICPALLWFTGAITGLDSRCSFLLGNTVNQMSEFALILANGLVGLGIFTDAMYITIVVATLVTFVLSSMGHVFADLIYDKYFKRPLSFLDRWCSVKVEEVDQFVMHKHVVLLGFNAVALEIAEYFRSVGQDVLVRALPPSLPPFLRARARAHTHTHTHTHTRNHQWTHETGHPARPETPPRPTGCLPNGCPFCFVVLCLFSLASAEAAALVSGVCQISAPRPTP